VNNINKPLTDDVNDVANGLQLSTPV